MLQKIFYAVFGFCSGMAFAIYIIAPILYFFTHKLEIPPYFSIVILALGIFGIFMGLRVDKFMNGKDAPNIIPNDQNFITKYLSFLATAKRQVEGTYISYTTTLSKILGTALVIGLLVYGAAKFIPIPYGNSISLIIGVLFLLAQLPESRDKRRSLSRKITSLPNGQKQIRFEMPKN
jgi:hypothetical protein